MTHVFLHIGAFKTGTSFIQSVLGHNKAALADHGALFPGSSWSDQMRAATGLKRRKGANRENWQRLVDEMDAWTGRSAIVSMEFLSTAAAPHVRRALESLRNHEVTIVLTARDLARVIPAQWQESVQNGHTWSYQDYLAGVTSDNPAETPAGSHFWRRQSWPDILQTWGHTLPRRNVVAVTVPPAGAPSGLLWQRFCSAVDLPADQFDTSLRVNESLGAASAEVVRHVTRQALDSGASNYTMAVIKKIIAKQALASHKSHEPALVLPPTLFGWVEERSLRLAEELAELQPTVVGDLTDLTPLPVDVGAATTWDPGALPSATMLEASAVGLVHLAEVVAAHRRRGQKAERNRSGS